MDVISNLAEVITQDSVDYRFEGVGGYGEIPVYDGSLMMRVTDILGRSFYYHVNVPCAE